MSYVINRKSVLETIVVIQLLKANLVHNRSKIIISPPHSVIFLVPCYLIIIVQICSSWDVVWNTICVNEACNSQVHICIELSIIPCTLWNTCDFQIKADLVRIKILTLVPYSDQILYTMTPTITPYLDPLVFGKFVYLRDIDRKIA